MSLPKIIVIVGPTASGKTEFAIETAEKIGGEIISADSLQVYKEFSICTSKPTQEQLKRVKHHLVGHISVSSEYSVYSFVQDAKQKIKEIINNKKTPIVTGGTGLYIDALINNFQFENSNCEENIDILSGTSRESAEKNNNKFFLKPVINILSSIAGESAEENNKNLYEILKKLDPLSAKYINQNDTKRISHAINFFNKFGFSIYNQKINTEKIKLESGIKKEFEVIKLGLNFKNRDILYERINKRVDLMLQNGLLEEINHVRKLKVSKTASAAIGYKELLPYFNGETTLYQAIEKIKQQTRRYAKRQITWFKRCPITKWIFKD